MMRRAPGGAQARLAGTIAAATVAQALLGIVTLLLIVPLWAGLAHQALAMVLLALAVAHAMRAV